MVARAAAPADGRRMSMFIQVISGSVNDTDGLRRLMDRWLAELRPGAHGYLGTTAGVAEDGRSVAIVRFATRDDAIANSNRPEQGAWWAEAEKCYAGPVTFDESDDVMQLFSGGTDSAGFVQVMQGRATVGDKARKLLSDSEGRLREHRPDLLGALIGFHDG